MPKSDFEKKFEVPGGTVTTREDGSVKIEGESVDIELDEDGKPRIKLKHVTTIGLENIIDVKSHSIETSTTAVSHHIMFRNGGEVRFSFRHTDGKLLEFSVTKAELQFKPDGAVMIIAQK